MNARLTGTGIWSMNLRYGESGEVAALAAELEELGYSALWVPDVGGELFGPLATLLQATSTATIATGILNVWLHTPDETAAGHAALSAQHGPRFLCGIGISHQIFVDMVKAPDTYRHPVETMAAYLDGLDAAEAPLRNENRMLAALGPKMLELARTRTAGTHPYLVTPELTARVSSRHRTTRPRGQRTRRGTRRGSRPSERPLAATSTGTSDCRTVRTIGNARASPTTTWPTVAATA